MQSGPSFIMDWPVTGDGGRITPYVNLRIRGYSLGLYRVRQCAENRMVVDQGETPLPLGSQLEVADVQGLLPHLPGALLARVVASDPAQVSLAW